VSNLIVFPILVPALTTALCLVAYRSPATRRALGVSGSVLHVGVSVALLVHVLSHGPAVLNVGSWQAPFGISLVADLLGALMVLLGALTGLATAIYSLADIDEERQRFGYFPLLHVLLMGVSGAFLTGDVFNLYVWFEVMLIASFVLTALGGERSQMQGALKYVTLNLVSSAIFLAAAGLLYATTRTLSFADLALRMPEVIEGQPLFAQSLAGLFLVAFGIKAALFPFFFWLPASYHTPPAAISAIFAGLLTKVGVYALIRVFVLIFPGIPALFGVLLFLSGFTMVVGVLGAYSQFEIRRILSFHIVSQIGYMVLGLALVASPDPAVRRLGLAAAVFYIGHHIIVKANLFLIGGTVRALRGTYDLQHLGGLFRAYPWLAVLFLVPAFSLAGIPPLSGFWAKLAMIRAGLRGEEYLLVGAAIFAGLLTLMSMIKIWNEAFWKPAPDDAPATEPVPAGRLALRIVPIAGLAAITVLIGLFPEPLFALADRAADQLLDPSGYVRLVLPEAMEGAGR
jgi:multicomponent Na+:H+ antiporter subunit D